MTATVITLPNTIRAEHHTNLVKVILYFAARAGDFSVEELLGPRRGRGVADYRMAAIYVIVKRCPHMSLPAIARLVHKDHSCVLYARNKVTADLLAGGKRFGFIVAEIETHLGLR